MSKASDNDATPANANSEEQEPIEVRTYRANVKQFRPSDVLLASVPRSGNTWMRLLLSDAILQSQGHPTDTGGNIIPDITKMT